MSQSYKFHRINPDGVVHNTVAADRALVLSETKNGNVFETKYGYMVVKPYGIHEFKDCASVARYIMQNERILHNEPKNKKTTKKESGFWSGDWIS